MTQEGRRIYPLRWKTYQWGKAKPVGKNVYLRGRKVVKRMRNNSIRGVLALRNRLSTACVLGEADAVVCVTTYGSRLEASAMALESIGAGRLRPRRLILWLDDNEAYRNLPASLQRLQKRGLEILLTDNYGPHTKYFPYVISQSVHQLPLVTADDDIMYPKSWLKDLVHRHTEQPDLIHCHWASRITADESGIARYISWPNCTSREPSTTHFALGVSGVIYPPTMLDALASYGPEFRELSPTADDVWLHWVALRQGFRVQQIHSRPRHFPLIPGTQDITLMESNNVPGLGNDKWIAGLYTPDDVLDLIASSP
jgi:hypothetical protein